MTQITFSLIVKVQKLQFLCNIHAIFLLYKPKVNKESPVKLASFSASELSKNVKTIIAPKRGSLMVSFHYRPYIDRFLLGST